MIDRETKDAVRVREPPPPPLPAMEIQRDDEDGFHGWIVRSRTKGVLRVFADDESQGASKALAAAIRFQLRRETGAPRPHRRKSETGIPGIRIGRVRTSSGKIVFNYTASWYDQNGERVARVFSWLKYGRNRALELAAEAREKGVADARLRRRSPKAEGPKARPAGRSPKSRLRHAQPTKYENVRRVDHHGFHGYAVALTRAGAHHAKYFNDEPDGRRAALERAIDHRDRLQAALPAPVKIHRRSSVSSTGIIGVVHSKERTRWGGWSERFSGIWFDEDGRRRKASYSVAKFGYQRAQELAENARNEGVAKLLHHRKTMILAEIETRTRARRSRTEKPHSK